MVKLSYYGFGGVTLCWNWKKLEGKKGVRPKIEKIWILGTFG